MWISIEQSVIVSVLFTALWDLRCMIGHVQLSLLIMGGPHWGIDNYKLFNYLICQELWLEGVYMLRMTPTKSFLYQTTHSIVMVKSPTAP